MDAVDIPRGWSAGWHLVGIGGALGCAGAGAISREVWRNQENNGVAACCSPVLGQNGSAQGGTHAHGIGIGGGTTATCKSNERSQVKLSDVL